jgi:L,D-transpeptidase ErfK/SrfK
MIRDPKIKRRSFLMGAAATAALPAGMSMAQEATAPLAAPRNISAFRVEKWQDHFPNLRKGVILADIESKVVQYWSEDESIYRMYPSTVPLTDQLTRRGMTSVVRKVVGPSWRPTPNMLKRNPDWPRYWPPGADNPLGTHALYLTWQYYRVHGTNDTRKIGRRSSNGCVGLYNEQIAELFEFAVLGTQVKLI